MTMTTWNYRVMRTSDEFVIREVYYRQDGSVESWTAGPAIPSSETLEGLAWLVDRYREALDKPVIDDMNSTS
jgi:hypothetical protein